MEETKQPPQFVNAEGFKWWPHELLTEYAKSKGLDMKTWIVESPLGVKELVTIDQGKPVHATQSLESVACWLDVMAFAKGND